jgi:hypothetical protein
MQMGKSTRKKQRERFLPTKPPAAFSHHDSVVLLDAGKMPFPALEEFPQKVRKKP